MAGRVEYVLDLGCGTATSASLYYLLYYPSSIVIGIDRDCNREWVESHLPEPVRRRFFFVPGDVGKLTIWKVEEHVARHMKIPLSRLTRVHCDDTGVGVAPRMPVLLACGAGAAGQILN